MSGPDYSKLFGELPPVNEKRSVGRSVGRPATGKRSDPDFERTSVFVRVETGKRVRRLLFDLSESREEELDFSDTVDEALQFWLEHGRFSTKK